MPPLLRLTDVFSGYGDIRALWGVSLEVNPGRLTLLLGRNGAGKTTTLNVIAGVTRTMQGRIEWDGHEISGLPTHRRVRLGIGLVQEGKQIFRRRTVEENLKLGGVWRFRDRRQLQEAVESAFARFPILREKRTRLASTLSGGEQQMLAIAQALIPGPQMLMLDEPSAGLAPEVVGRVFRAIDDLKHEGIGVLLVEQVSDSLKIADDVSVLDLGRIVLRKPAAEMADVSVIRDLYIHGARDSS